MTDYRVVAMCPGCNEWSIEVDQGEALEVVESILQEHASVCPWLEALATVCKTPE